MRSSIRAVGCTALLLAAGACGTDRQPDVSGQSPPQDPVPGAAIARTDEVVATAATPPPNGAARAPCRDAVPGCTVVDWDVAAVEGSTVQLTYYVNDPGCSGDVTQVDVNEDDSSVTFTVLVDFTGDGDGTCPTAYAARTTVVNLAAPLGERAIYGCRPFDSFVPQGGYNEPDRAPRSDHIDCRAAAPSASSTTPTTAQRRNGACHLGPVMEIGAGLSAALPTDATFVEGASTADFAPHASVSYDYDVSGERFAVGRHLRMPTVVYATGEASRQVGDAVLFVISDDTNLRECVLATMSYDASRDQ